MVEKMAVEKVTNTLSNIGFAGVIICVGIFGIGAYISPISDVTTLKWFHMLPLDTSLVCAGVMLGAIIVEYVMRSELKKVSENGARVQSVTISE